MALRLRSARQVEAGVVAALHAASLRDAYRAVLDPARLDAAGAALEADWREALAGRRRQGVVILATAAGEPVGLVAAWRDGATCRVSDLHVRPGMRGAGIGRALICFAAQRLAAHGCTAAEMAVPVPLTGALRFASRLGAALGEERAGTVLGQPIAECPCLWPDIDVLRRGGA